MRLRPPIAAVLLAASFSAHRAAASTFDAEQGVVHFEASALLTVGFEDAESLRKLAPARLAVDVSRGYATFTSVTAPLDAQSFQGPGIEGAHALRVGARQAVRLGDAATLNALGSGRVELTFFAKADGARPDLLVVYDNRALEPDLLSFPYGHVAAIRTGRATTDGWVEYTSGPIDGIVRGRPIAGLLLLAENALVQADAGFFVDALEVRRVGETPLSGATCHIATQAKDCTVGAVCIEARCTDAALVYGPLPTAEQRRAFVGRQETYLASFQSDRHAAAVTHARFQGPLAQAVANAKTPDAFYEPFYETVSALRAAHTGSAQGRRYSILSQNAGRSLRYRGTELDTCFGVIDKDLSGGGRGFGVYATEKQSPLSVGDVLTAIDDEAPEAWLARVSARDGFLMADADADAAGIAGELSAEIMRYARSLTVLRCTNAGKCVGADARTVRVDLDPLRLARGNLMTCGPRFQRGIAIPTGVDPDAYETALSEDRDGITTVYTNGEPPVTGTGWLATVEGAFERRPTAMLVDKRRGDGGGGEALRVWQSYVRQDPTFGQFWMGRYGYESADGPASLLPQLTASCTRTDVADPFCLGYGSRWDRIAPAATPRPPKIAWLSVLAGSASDMAAAYAKGVPGVRIFGPNRTVGLFGGLQTMPSFYPGFSGGAVQTGDSRLGFSQAELLAAPWHSGRGIEPDEVVAQTESDLLAGRDTLVERARAWLREP